MTPVCRYVGRATVGAVFLVGAACRESVGPGAEYLVSQPQWEWQSACCGITGVPRTPDSEGYRYVLQFSRNGRVLALRNDTVLVETGFRVIVSGDDDTTDQLIRVVYDEALPLGPGIVEATEHMVIPLQNSTLLLRNLSPCADCYSDWTFVPALVLAP